MTENADVMAALLARIDELETRLQSVETEAKPVARVAAEPEAASKVFGRRALLAKLGGAGVAGAGLAVAGSALLPGVAAAGPTIFNSSSDSDGVHGDSTASGRSGVYGTGSENGGWGVFGAVGGSSSLPSGSAGVVGDSGSRPGVIANSRDQAALLASSKSATSAAVVVKHEAGGIALSATATGAGYGIESNSQSGVAVAGISTDNTGVAGAGPTGVAGIGTPADGIAYGVTGSITSTGTPANGDAANGAGVFGAVRKGFGPTPVATSAAVAGLNEGLGFGALIVSAKGIGIQAQGLVAPLQLVPAAGTGAPLPASGAHTKGEIYLDSLGTLLVCVTDGTPGTWTKVAVGSGVQLLPKPIRLYDTRANGAPYPPGPATKLAPSTTAHYDLQVTGTTVGGVSVPAGATGVIGTLSVTATVDPGAGNAGYLTVYATGAPPSPATADLTWFGPNETLSVAVTSSLSTTGQMAIHNGMVGGSSAAHVIFDAKGYIT
jgi:hypothetical protein